jgi:hypothetical protein
MAAKLQLIFQKSIDMAKKYNYIRLQPNYIHPKQGFE